MSTGEVDQPFEAIDHVQLAMPPSEEEQVCQFYAGILGLEEVPKPPELAQRGGAWFRSGSAVIHLGVDSNFHPATKAHPAFRCANYEALVARLRKQGVTVVDDPNPVGNKAHCYISDPFGNRIELIAK